MYMLPLMIRVYALYVQEVLTNYVCVTGSRLFGLLGGFDLQEWFNASFLDLNILYTISIF